MIENRRILEKCVAVAAFVVAAALSFTALLINNNNEIAANNMWVIAQFLTFAATLLGIDYKFTHERKITTGDKK